MQLDGVDLWRYLVMGETQITASRARGAGEGVSPLITDHSVRKFTVQLKDDNASDGDKFTSILNSSKSSSMLWPNGSLAPRGSMKSSFESRERVFPDDESAIVYFLTAAGARSLRTLYS